MQVQLHTHLKPTLHYLMYTRIYKVKDVQTHLVCQLLFQGKHLLSQNAYSFINPCFEL